MTGYELQITNYKLRSEYAWALIAIILAAFIALFFSFQAGVFALVFTAAAFWVWHNPEKGFLFFIVLAPLLPMLKITQTIGTASLIKDVIIITLFVRLFLIPLLTKQLPYRRNILVAPIVALVAWAAIETLRADSLILGVLRARDIVLYILLYFAVLYLAHTKQTMKRRLQWFAASFLVVLALGAWQWFFAQDSAVLRFDPVREVWIPRLSSVLAHPSIFGQYLVMGTTLFAAAALFVKNMRARLLLAALAAATLPFIFLTYSRAVWIGLVAAGGAMGLVYLIRLAKQKISKAKLSSYALAASAAAIILFIVALQFTPAGGYIRSIVDPTYGSNEERLTFFVRLIAPVTNTEAVVGSGLGDVLAQNFREVDLEAYDIAAGSSRAVQLTKNRTLVDNQYLKTFIEMGVIGLVLFGWLYWRVGYHAISLVLDKYKTAAQFQISNFKFQNTIGLWVVGFLAAFIIQALFIDIWDIFPTNAAFWIVAALVSAQSK